MTSQSNINGKGKIRVLLTNDDGPPNEKESPFIYGFAKAIRDQLGWETFVVIPSSQKSWIGKAYHIKETIHGKYYYPGVKITHFSCYNMGASTTAKGPKGDQGQASERSRPLEQDESEEWILLDGTPASCANIALHNIYPKQIDLVISGPNFGRNSSSAFALSSGTVGAALAASITGIPSLALSYGIFEKPVPEDIVTRAHKAACDTVDLLWREGFGGETDAELYSINIPLTPKILEGRLPQRQFTIMASRRYGRLFKQHDHPEAKTEGQNAPPNPQDGPSAATEGTQTEMMNKVLKGDRPLKFSFSPDLDSLVNPNLSDLEEGTDIHALHSGKVSITPLKATFALGKVGESVIQSFRERDRVVNIGGSNRL